MNKENLLEKTGKEIRLSRYVRFVIFVVLVGLSIVMSGDNGVVSSCSEEIKRDLQLSDAEYGLFGSLPGTGRIIGSLVFMVVLQIFENRKYITLICLCVNGGMFYLYSMTSNKYILYCVRFVIGIVRIYPHIFNDMWVNQFGIQKLKTLMITAFKVSSPLGQTFGFTVGTFIPKGKYAIGFAIIGTSILSLGAILLFCPSDYFMAKYMFVGYMDEERLVSKPTDRTSASFFATGEGMKKKEKKGGSILNILVNGAYLSSLYVRANLLFIFQVIHLNIKSYCLLGLGVEDKTQLLKYYLPASAFGPTIGGILGGFIATVIGGYQSPNSAWYVLATAILTLIAIIPVAFSPSIAFLGISLFAVFFFASAMFPVTEGWAQNALPKEHAGAGSSFKMFLTNICGNALGPIVYGFLSDKFKAKDPTLAWKITMCYYILGFVAAIFAVILNYKFLKGKEDKTEKTPAKEEPVSTELGQVEDKDKA